MWYFEQLLNTLWIGEVFPQQWKMAIIILIIRIPGKNSTIVKKSSKLMEKIINKRLVAYLEEVNIIAQQ